MGGFVRSKVGPFYFQGIGQAERWLNGGDRLVPALRGARNPNPFFYEQPAVLLFTQGLFPGLSWPLLTDFCSRGGGQFYFPGSGSSGYRTE